MMWDLTQDPRSSYWPCQNTRLMDKCCNWLAEEWELKQALASIKPQTKHLPENVKQEPRAQSHQRQAFPKPRGSKGRKQTPVQPLCSLILPLGRSAVEATGTQDGNSLTTFKHQAGQNRAGQDPYSGSQFIRMASLDYPQKLCLKNKIK